MNKPSAIATAIRHEQAVNGCAAYFRSQGTFATFPGAPCTPDCVCAKKASESKIKVVQS